MKITKAIVQKLVKTVDAGLCRGKGIQEPGKMCVEAAVCYAFGLPHSDEPPCVGSAVRSFKIALNDSRWSDNAARAKGLKRIAVAQLGSESLDQQDFSRRLALETVRQIVPIPLRAVAKRLKSEHAEKFEAAAVKCEKADDLVSAKKAAAAAAYAAYAAYAAAYAAYAANAAANAAAYYAADAADAANAAANAANAAANAANAANAGAGNEVLSKMAEIAVQILIDMKSPGCEWLHLCD